MKKIATRYVISFALALLLVVGGDSEAVDNAKFSANSESHIPPVASRNPAVKQRMPLWKRSKVGMTIAQVKALFPNAHAPKTEPDEIAGWQKGLLVLDDIELVNNKFKATFFFNKENGNFVFCEE